MLNYTKSWLIVGMGVHGNGMMVQNGMMLLFTKYGAKENHIMDGVIRTEWRDMIHDQSWTFKGPMLHK